MSAQPEASGGNARRTTARIPSRTEVATHATAQVPRRRLTGWQIFGIVCAVIFLVASLAAIAFAVLFMIALASWGSNK